MFVFRKVALLAFLQCIVFATVSSSAKFEDKSFIKVLYGSCHSTRLRSPLWPFIVDRKPDVWIFGGDNMYADRMLKDPLTAVLKFQLPFEQANETDLIKAYKDLHEDPGYKSLVDSGVEQIAIWDDHDYGINDGDKTYPLREASKEIFLREMVKADKNDPRWKQNGGIYLSRTYKTKRADQSLRIIALDVRYSKDPWHVPRLSGDMLGEEQWAWLEKTLCEDRSPRVNIIISGLQILPENRGAGEAWIKFPNERQRLFSLLSKCQVRAPVLVSGDVHMAEMFEATCSSNTAKTQKSTLVEVTSSGLTHSWATRAPGWSGEIPAVNFFLKQLMIVAQTIMPWNYRSNRAKGAPSQGAYFLGLNFAEIDVDFDNEKVQIDVVGAENKPVLSQSWTFQELDMVYDANGQVTCGPRRGEESMVQLVLARAVVVSVFGLIPISLALYLPYWFLKTLVRLLF